MSSTPMRPGGAPVSHFVGRTGELISLRAIADSSIEAGANLVIVSGDAGIGKSRVVRELLVQLRREGWQGHVGHCIEHAERPLPFGPIIQILRSLAEDLDQPGLDQIVGHRRGDLASLLPELGVDAIRGASLNGDVDRLLDAISATLTEAARQQPLALVVEDIHWSDAATRDLLASLVHSLGTANVLLLVTERLGSADRGHPLRTWLAELRRLPNVASLTLEGLTRQELAEQATGLLGRVPSNDVVDDLAERTGGNPYFAQELIVAKQQGLTTLPSSLAEFLMSRVERLDGDERTVLSALAVAGGNVEHATLDRMLPDLAIGPVVRTLYDASVLVVTGTSYSFWHGLLREAILRDLLPFEAEDLHRLAAEAMDQESSRKVSPSDLARLALHWGHAGNPERSLEVAVAAADASASVAAFETAADMALQALRAWPQVGSAEERASRSRDQLLLQAIDWLADCHRGDRAIELATEALAGWGSGLPPGRRALLLAQMAPIEFRLGNPAKSTELLAEAAQLVGEEVSPEAAQVHHRTSMQALEDAQIQPALEAAERAIVVASTHGPQAVLVEAMATKALTIGVIGEYEEGLALVREARKLALVDGLVSVAAQTYRTEMIIIEFRHGRTDAAMSALEKGLAHANRHCGPRWRARFQHDLCNLYIDAGRFLDAEPLLKDLLATTVNDLRRLSVVQLAGLHALGTGSLDDAAMFLADADELAERYQSAQETGYQHRLVAELARRQSRIDDALELIDQALKLQTGGDNLTFTRESLLEKIRILKARAELGHADTTQIRNDVTELVNEFEGLGAANIAFRSLMELELASIDGLITPEAAAETIDLLDSAGYSYEAALTRLLLVEHLVRSRDQRALVEAELRRLHQIALDRGMSWVVDKVDSLAKLARINVAVDIDLDSASRGDVQSYPHNLTRREVEILALLAEGLTNKSVAERLYVSPRTVSTHVSNVLAKLGVTNRTEAGAVYHRLGIETILETDRNPAMTLRHIEVSSTILDLRGDNETRPARRQ